MRIVTAAGVLPDHYYTQGQLVAALEALWARRHHNRRRLERLHRNVLVGGRHLALPLDGYEALRSFTDTNDAYIRCAVDLGERAVRRALAAAGLTPADVDHLFFVSVTGLAVPSVDARLFNRLGLNRYAKRTPIFGLGCAAGAAGVGRAADYLRAFPGEVAVLLSVELCSLTLQREDLSVANFIASGLFGDGAAAVVLAGGERAVPAASGAAGPQVVATRSSFYPGTEDLMGWRISERGFELVLSAEVPRTVVEHLGGDVDAFLAARGLARRDIGSYICHPGGPRVLEAVQQALSLPPDALELSWRSLREVGNLSSASVLMVLCDTLSARRPPPGTPGLMLAMGPGFGSELVLLRW